MRWIWPIVELAAVGGELAADDGGEDVEAEDVRDADHEDERVREVEDGRELDGAAQGTTKPQKTSLKLASARGPSPTR